LGRGVAASPKKKDFSNFNGDCRNKVVENEGEGDGAGYLIVKDAEKKK